MEELLLAWMAAYGMPVLALALLSQPLGLPLPTGLLVLAAGAGARQGSIDGLSAFALSLAAAVVGDCVTYALGRAAGPRVQRRLGARCRALWLGAEGRLLRRGAEAVFLTRVALTSLEMATNLAAGSSHFPFRRFLAWDAAGRATWIGLYGGLGYLLGSRWTAARQAIGTHAPWLGGAGLAAIALLLFSGLLRRRLARKRPSQPAALQETGVA